jgi:photosystem II stability/assembly factor-like uncharacterized protein
MKVKHHYNRLIILFLIFFITQVNYSQWNEINPGTSSNLRSIFFINENEGWIAGDNLLLFTVDQGETWNKKELPGIHNSIFFIDEMTGWVCTEAGEIYKTTDEGVTWDLKQTGTIFPLTTIKFINHQVGFAAGYFQKVLKSTDGGETWYQSIHNGYQHLLTSFVGSEDFIIITGTDGSIFKTTDLGVTWDSSNVRMPNGLYSVSFVNQNTGFIFGCCGSYFKSFDGGLTWEDRGYLTDGYIIYSSCFVNENTGWAAGEVGWLLKTTDGGETWLQYSRQSTDEFRSVVFINENVGFVAGMNGLILKTTNGGGSTTDIDMINESSLNSFVLQQNYPNPFNPTTKIKYSIPSNVILSGAKNLYVTLKVYNILGKEIATLVNEEKTAGNYEVEFDAANLSSGIYFYKLEAGTYSETKKMVLLK